MLQIETKGAREVVREVGAEPKVSVQGGCHIYKVTGDKTFEIKAMALLYRRRLKASYHI